MQLRLRKKQPQELLTTDLLFQTSFWGDVKSRLGWKPLAFDFVSGEPSGDLLVLKKDLLPGTSVAYIPQGPEFSPAQDQYGPFLEELSDELTRHLNTPVSFIRYDLPWESPYVSEPLDPSQGEAVFQRPEARLQELRMNFGTRSWNLQKAAFDLTFADRVVVDLDRATQKILSGMKPKTRYNIRLAAKKGVKVVTATRNALPAFYELYTKTAARGRFHACGYEHFSTLFSSLSSAGEPIEILFLLAEHDRDLLAGAIVAISGGTATYLFGASAGTKRPLMAPYALHWTAMQMARDRGCTRYDLGAVSPWRDPDHPYFGLYRFKTGFGGNIVHQSGSWDYPLNEETYRAFRSIEMFDS